MFCILITLGIFVHNHKFHCLEQRNDAVKFVYSTLLMKRTIACLFLFATLLCACTSPANRKQSFIESFNARCPISIEENGVDISHATRDKNAYALYITLNRGCATSVPALRKIDSHYSIGFNGVGSRAFLYHLENESQEFGKAIDEIKNFIYTNDYNGESTQGFLQLRIIIKDCGAPADSIIFTYNEQYETDDTEPLNAIMPPAFIRFFGGKSGEQLPGEIFFTRVPRITDGCLNIFCHYYPLSINRKDGKSISIGEVREKYMNEGILLRTIETLMTRDNATRRFINACIADGITLRCEIDDTKDVLDYDLASPELVREYSNCGGYDEFYVSNEAFAAILHGAADN